MSKTLTDLIYYIRPNFVFGFKISFFCDFAAENQMRKLFSFLEIERGGIDAVAQSGRFGSVVKNVSEMRIAARA